MLPDQRFPWEYLRQASDPSLRSYELSRLNHAANLRKEITALIDQWVEETAAAILARWMIEYRTAERSPEPTRRVDIEPEAPLLETPQLLATSPRARRKQPGKIPCRP